MNNAVMFSSASDHWSTPSELYQALDKEFNFDFDPCPLNCTKFDGLSIKWGNMNFVNPPYSDIKNWMKKAAEERKEGRKSVLLVPSRTDTKWWHEYAMNASEIRFLKGRLKFGDSKNSAPFPSALVIFI